MKLREIFRFELAYQLRRPWPWLLFAVLLVISFLLGKDTSLEDALFEQFFANSSFAVARTTVIGTLFWLLAAAAIAGDAGSRDVASGMHPLTYTLPVRRVDYLGGRFLAAFVLNASILLAVQAGCLIAVYSPGVDAQVIGPFRIAVYLTAYAFISLPNAFIGTALQFALALRSGRAMTGYFGSVLLVFMGFFVATILNFVVLRGLGTLLDPVGIYFIVEDLAHDWTTIEKSWRLLALEGTLLQNRSLWVGIGTAILAVTYLRFRFAHRTERSRWWRRARRASAHAPAPVRNGVATRASILVPEVARSFGFAIQARQSLAIAWASFRTVARSWAGLFLLVAVPLVTVLVVLDQLHTMGTPLVAKTAIVLRQLTGGLSADLAAEPGRWLIVPLFLVFFAGELIWRERDAGLGEITDAMPGSEWTPLIGKLSGLALLLVVFMALLTAAGMLAQVISGHREFEIGLYVKTLFGLQLVEYLLFAVLAFVVHVIVDQRYVGHLVAILAFAWVAVLASLFGFEHNLLVYGHGPGWSYTEMRGFGPFLGPWAWFKLYWAAWALLLAVLARIFWVRGKETRLRPRLSEACPRFTRATAAIAAVATALILGLGGFIFYNTNVLNEYASSADGSARSAEYERRYGEYAHVPQPALERASLHVDFHPARDAVEARGAYGLVNDTSSPIDSIHVTTAVGVETRAITFDRPSSIKLDDAEHGYRIYALEKPLEPGDALQLSFEVRVEPRGFTNGGVRRTLTANGSSFNGQAWFPFVGYQRDRELTSSADRRAHGLAERPVLASLYDVEGREPAMRGGRIAFEAIVGTDADQVAVAPGALRRTWTENGRSYFHYSTDGPIGEEWGFFSATYALREDRWRDVDIRILHHPEHTAHVDRVLRSVRASLEYYSEQFGPYPYGHLTVVEQAGAPGTGAHADPSIVSHGEGVAYWMPHDAPGSLDVPYFVFAHEMAHQWTLPYALVEGLPFLAEGIANYFAIQLVKETLGEESFRRLMSFMRQPFPYRPIRRGEPLLQALDPYLARRKGPYAMLALSEYIGADRVNGALKRLIEKHDAAGAPLATTLDLYRELQAITPESHRYLLHDLFEVNAFWMLRTERAAAKPNEDGTWQVTLDLRARKVVFDVAGAETEMPMDERVPIGVFGRAELGAGELSAPLHLEMHRIRSGAQTITVTVAQKPELAGIDPHHLLDWEEREDDDNVAAVELE